MDNVIIRKGRIEDAKHFSPLILFSAPEFLPYLFGSNVTDVLKKLFRDTDNWFNFEHTHFVESSGEIAGTALAFSYEQKKKEELRTGELIMKYVEVSSYDELPDPRATEISGLIEAGDYYFSNMGIQPQFRSLGFGTKIFGVIEEEARKSGCKRVVFDVETDNTRAIKLYERLGYEIEAKSPILETSIKNFEFFKMSKEVQKTNSQVMGGQLGGQL